MIDFSPSRTIIAHTACRIRPLDLCDSFSDYFAETVRFYVLLPVTVLLVPLVPYVPARI